VGSEMKSVVGLEVVAAMRDTSSDMWETEADVALQAGAFVRGLALTLPSSSVLRADLLAQADDWCLLAALRGRTPSVVGLVQPQTASG
jgi:hypothetical protein